MSRLLVVELEDLPHESRYVGLFHAIRLLPGVHSVTDLASISQETLDLVLLKPEPVAFDDESEVERAWQLEMSV